MKRNSRTEEPRVLLRHEKEFTSKQLAKKDNNVFVKHGDVFSCLFGSLVFEEGGEEVPVGSDCPHRDRRGVGRRGRVGGGRYLGAAGVVRIRRRRSTPRVRPSVSDLETRRSSDPGCTGTVQEW